MTSTTEIETQTPEQSAQNQQAQPIVIGLSDLVLMANIIQVTSERGAIKANEMQSVGALYSKLVAFVNANAPASDNQENTASEE